MMTIVHNGTGPDARPTLTWHVGSHFPLEIRSEEALMALVVAVIADGDELDLLVDKFEHLPRPRYARRVTWVGEMAWFIVVNMAHDSTLRGR